MVRLPPLPRYAPHEEAFRTMHRRWRHIRSTLYLTRRTTCCKRARRVMESSRMITSFLCSTSAFLCSCLDHHFRTQPERGLDAQRQIEATTSFYQSLHLRLFLLTFVDQAEPSLSTIRVVEHASRNVLQAAWFYMAFALPIRPRDHDDDAYGAQHSG